MRPTPKPARARRIAPAVSRRQRAAAVKAWITIRRNRRAAARATAKRIATRRANAAARAS